MAMTLLHALRLNARRNPRRTAIRFRGTALSYAELLRRAERAMCTLAELGLRPGEKVPMLSHNHADMLVAYFALTGIGAIPAPLNYRLADDDLRHGIDAAHARFVLLGSGFAERADALADPAWRWIWFADAEDHAPADALRWRALQAPGPGSPPEGRASSTVMLHTSGTTGRPKGALRSRFGFEERAIEQGFGIDDQTLCVLPICLGAGCVYTLLPLYLGASVHLHEHFDAGAVIDAIESEGIHSSMLLPAMLQAMIEHPRFASAGLSSLRVIQSGAGALSGALKRALLDRFGDGILNIYAASSEVGPYANLKGAEVRDHLDSNCVGRPFFGVELKLLGDDGVEVRPGEVGEICCRSDSQYDEYFEDDELTRSTRRGDFLTVGDLGRLDSQGLLHFVGRKRDIIKSGGINIYASEIEEVLQQHPAVVEAHCVGLPDDRWTELICAVIVARSGEQPTVDEITSFAAAHLAAYKKPRRVVFMTEVPKNLTGRVLKVQLVEQVMQALAAPSDVAASDKGMQ
ncbi:class I adenylate-forming enzyme family protein [Piscinibacter sakaiensis]|uniref:class I adenylate-forming enzyme family protein n=1 Tax=Piscinibacter sakaiensis TaxID=1547922 RepID=UPI003AAE2829